MECKYVKLLKSEKLIDEYECLVKYVFNESFRKFVLKNNGGRPDVYKRQVKAIGFLKS